MTRPGPRIYASNPVWVGGPDAGTASKVPASAGALADGVYRNLRPAPQLWNYEWWALSSKLHNLNAMRVLNMVNADVSLIAGLTGGPCDGMSEPVSGVSTFHDATAANLWEEVLDQGTLGAIVWQAGAPPIGAATPRLACDTAALAGNVTRGAVSGLPAGANQIAWSTAFGLWAGWAGVPLAGPVVPTHIGHDWNAIPGGLWVIGTAGGGATAIWISTGPGVNFGAPATPPAGWAANPTVAIEHTHHAAGDVYPNDPGNQRWIVMSTTQVTSSSNGNVWTAAAAHGIVNPVDLAYGKCGTKWICVDVATGLTQSTDNGVTWAPIAGLPGGGVLSALGLTATEARIATDGYGDWMVGIFDAAPPMGCYGMELYASWDDGVTWSQVMVPAIPLAGITGGSLWYGNGRFHVMAIAVGGAPTSQAFESLRAG